jgi:hypothetical protein
MNDITRTSKELLPRLRDGSAACARSADRHGDGEIGQMFSVLADTLAEAANEIERLRTKKCDCDSGACQKCSTAPVTEIVGKPASAQDTSHGGSARAVTEQQARDSLYNEWRQAPNLGYEHWLETEVLRLRASNEPPCHPDPTGTTREPPHCPTCGCSSAHEPAPALCVDPAFEGTRCPFTKLPYFMHLEHPELGRVPTYGGPYDSYTMPVPDDDNERTLRSERYDHDEGAWIEGGEPWPINIVTNEEFVDLHTLREERASQPPAVTHIALLEHHDVEDRVSLHAASYKAVLVPPGQSLDFDPEPGAERRWLWPYLGRTHHLVAFIEVATSSETKAGE